MQQFGVKLDDAETFIRQWLGVLDRRCAVLVVSTADILRT
jgi:hypothetical protein